ncbi:conserved hypothetical protein [Ricinus communis]|uniref:Retrotransposon gag domain-containing protein n=1 Tax=Ricinus communis TaxID=3988 RepID=B9R6V1_RICCO|nr:conserved hypothetical protein [Ricinus communis]
MNRTEEPPRDEYIEALKGRFGEKIYEDPMADLKGLMQTGTLQEYLEAFDSLSHKVTLPEDYSLNFFLSGLKDEIRIPVRMLGPKSLQQAYALARMQESYLTATKLPKTYANRPQITPNPSSISKLATLFTPGHKCKKRHLHMVVVQDYPKEEVNTLEETLVWSGEVTSDVNPAISLHATEG